ncbi:hypothetical protein L3i22_036960 [Actinoplanes sp. L3-i22]|nr:hypothetical protein L3i22_036960 [Actinoplanes sp. L3-i22]
MVASAKPKSFIRSPKEGRHGPDGESIDSTTGRSVMSNISPWDVDVQRSTGGAAVVTAQAARETAPAGWYADPSGVFAQRWWDGQQWTESVQPVPETVGVHPHQPTATGPIGQNFQQVPADPALQPAGPSQYVRSFGLQEEPSPPLALSGTMAGVSHERIDVAGLTLPEVSRKRRGRAMAIAGAVAAVLVGGPGAYITYNYTGLEDSCQDAIRIYANNQTIRMTKMSADAAADGIALSTVLKEIQFLPAQKDGLTEASMRASLIFSSTVGNGAVSFGQDNAMQVVCNATFGYRWNATAKGIDIDDL